VLAVDGQQPSSSPLPCSEGKRAGGDQALLVRQGEVGATFERPAPVINCIRRYAGTARSKRAAILTRNAKIDKLTSNNPGIAARRTTPRAHPGSPVKRVRASWKRVVYSTTRIIPRILRAATLAHTKAHFKTCSLK